MQSYPNKKPFTIKNRLKSFVYAFKGIKQVVVSQHNMWIHIVFALLAIALGFMFEINATEWIAIVLSIGLVLTAEIFNTAIESLVDLISPNFNEKAGKIKDIAAAAVLITAITAVIIGMIIFSPHIINLYI